MTFDVQATAWHLYRHHPHSGGYGGGGGFGHTVMHAFAWSMVSHTITRLFRTEPGVMVVLGVLVIAAGLVLWTRRRA